MQTFLNWREKLISLIHKSASYLRYFYSFAMFLWRRWLPHLKRFHFNAFPSVRLKEFNKVDLAFKFSTEAIILALAFLVAGWNVYFFNKSENYEDKSHAAKLIAAKQDLNPKLYARMSVINTVVLTSNSLVPKAQAEEFVSADPASIYGTEDDTQDFVLSDDGIVQPNPDSVEQLLARQIKVYKTSEGDTLRQIAADNGLKVQTLLWANKLTSERILPGWFLIIPPTDGILHKAASNDTLPDIAHKYNPDRYNTNATVRENSANKLLEDIISYNGLEGAEDINPGDVLIVPGGVIPTPPAPAAKPKNTDGKVNPKGSAIPDLGNGTGHIFPKGYCTWYVASKVHVPWGGNAKSWLSNARAMGYTVTSHAVPGSIVVTTDNLRYGHVALVESVSEKGFTVSEMNYEKFGKVNTRFIPHGSKIIRGFIIP